MIFSPQQTALIQAESGCSAATVSKFAKGIDVREATRLRIVRACAALGIELPATWFTSTGQERSMAGERLPSRHLARVGPQVSTDRLHTRARDAKAEAPNAPSMAVLMALRQAAPSTEPHT